ncbi:MAG TPA: hypothetical protein PKC03_13315 [Dokdonella sp.]|jgi:disulfide bond formation protein DsbB|nr:hypothetical protein [Dokdonella sp.]
MTRWIMIAMTVLGLIIAFITRSPGVLGIAILMVLIGMFGTVMSLAAERVSAKARPDATMLPPEVLHAIGERARAKAGQTAGPARGPDQQAARAAGAQQS